MKEKKFNHLKDIACRQAMAPGTGTAMCAGCGGLAVIKMMCNVLGKNTIIVNSAGCMTLLSLYPFTPFQGSWLYTAMASASAGAQGVRDALDILISKKWIPPEEDLHVIVLSGDGSAYGMGLSATSGAMDRNLDFIYLCYDNEGYGNTGHQLSPATPHGAITTTSHAPTGNTGYKKDLFSIWIAHNPAYAATIINSEPLDLARKIEKGMGYKGPKLFLALSPCPTGWHFNPEKTVEIGKIAVKTGIWPLKEYMDGKINHTKIPKKRIPVEDYLKVQGRFRHLFTPARAEKKLADIQNRVDGYWKSVGAF